jgi:rare lipoprotein A
MFTTTTWLLGFLAALLGSGVARVEQYGWAYTNVSFYSEGQRTANGECFNPMAYTAASPTLRFNRRVVLQYEDHLVMVRINDRGPFEVDSLGHVIYPLHPHPTRGFDLSLAAFKQLGPIHEGVLPVQIVAIF